jgi:hypothetical protein
VDEFRVDVDSCTQIKLPIRRLLEAYTQLRALTGW